jgi:hypothetical protein
MIGIDNQVLSILTFYSANHVFPDLLSLTLPGISKSSFTLTDVAGQGAVRPDLVEQCVSRCPFKPSQARFTPRDKARYDPP